MSIEVIRPGLSTTVQDLGRYRYQKHGVIVGGAMDSLALRMANLLVGNPEGEAVLEITLIGPKLKFEADHLISICGGNLSPKLEGVPLPMWRPVLVKKGSILQFGQAKMGCRAYLAIAGGIDVPVIMGSRSTYLRAGIGGYHGRSLKEGDRICSNSYRPYQLNNIQDMGPFKIVHWSVGRTLLAPYEGKPIIRVIRGPQFGNFTKESQEQLFEYEFQVSPQSDRMGYRLSGPPLILTEPMELISEAVAPGTIQVPPGGQPIVLLADRQTTGGYPKIGYVASVDLPVLAQLKPGETFQFQEVSLSEAQRLLINREKEITALKVGIQLLTGGR